MHGCEKWFQEIYESNGKFKVCLIIILYSESICKNSCSFLDTKEYN